MSQEYVVGPAGLYGIFEFHCATSNPGDACVGIYLVSVAAAAESERDRRAAR